MSTIDKKVHPFAAFARDPVTIYSGDVAISQAAVLHGAIVPYQGFPAGQPPYALWGWQVENVQVFCAATAATASVDVQIAGVSVLTGLITPVAATVVQGTLVATLATRRGKFADALQCKMTTNGTGTITKAIVTVTIRPWPLDNEAA